MQSKKMLGFKIITTLLKPVFKFWYKPKVFLKCPIPDTGAVVIACNHKHIMDQCMVILATKRPINYMAKSEYFKGKFAWFFKLTGCICVNRNGSDEEAKKTANSVLRRNGAIGIFPEGTRNRTDNLLMDFKYGAASLACKNGAMIVPVAVTGEYKFRSKTLASRIGQPFSTDGMTVEAVRNKLHEEIAQLIKENLSEGYGTEDEFLKAENYFNCAIDKKAI